MATNKHLTDLDRPEIEHALKERSSIKKIAAKIGKHPSTVAREILARSVVSNKGAYGRITNRCVTRFTCTRRQLCEDKPDCTRRCSTCHLCNSRCPAYREAVCPKLAEVPYVCNGCKDEFTCVLRKRYYLHTPAHKSYRKLLIESRAGANITEGELIALDELVELNRQGALEAGQKAEASADQSQIVFTVLLVVGLLLTLFTAWLLSRSITQPLEELKAVAARIAGGDLSQAVRCEGSDEITDVQRSLEQMQGSIRALQEEINRRGPAR